MPREKLRSYKATLPKVFSSASSAVGINVMLIVLERSLWKVKNKYPEADLIRFSENGVFFDGLEILAPEKAILIIEEFMAAVTEILGRLIGTNKYVFQLQLSQTETPDTNAS